MPREPRPREPFPIDLEPTDDEEDPALATGHVLELLNLLYEFGDLGAPN